MKFNKIAVFLLATLLKVSPSFALGESGLYIVGNLGYGFVSNNTLSHSTNNNSYTLGVNLGYSFSQYFALDAGTTFMPNNNGYGVFSNYFLSSMALKAGYPIGDFFLPYIHVGPGVLANMSQGTSQFGLFTGLGGVFKLSQSFGLTVEDYGILIPNNSSNNVNIFAIGAMYDF